MASWEQECEYNPDEHELINTYSTVMFAFLVLLSLQHSNQALHSMVRELDWGLVQEKSKWQANEWCLLKYYVVSVR